MTTSQHDTAKLDAIKDIHNSLKETAVWAEEFDDYPLAAETKVTLLQMSTTFFIMIHDNDLQDQIDDWEMVGHDLWLTARGHGAGFWDGDWEESLGVKLTKLSEQIAKEFPVDIYLGDDYQLYLG